MKQLTQANWLQTRKRLLRKIKAEVSQRLGEPPAAFRQYAKKLNGEFRGRWRECRWQDLLKAVGGADVVFASDFHAHSQSQRAQLRTLRALPESQPVVLALECVCAEDTDAINRFLKSEISENEFVEAIAWTKVWGFPWEHYRPIFELARERGYAIAGLSRRSDSDGESALQKRDRRMATDILELKSEYPVALVYVMVGELHLAEAHLPDAFLELQPDAEIVLIYQDAEQLYFRLAKTSRDQSVDVLRSGKRFCMMVSPPWVKWQNYLMYLEQTYDRELDEDESIIDYTDHVKQLVELLVQDFSVQVETSSIHVYTPASKDALKLLHGHFPRAAWPVLQMHLEDGRSFLIPEKGLIYLAVPSLNRAASLAGQFLHARLCGRRDLLWNPEEYWEALIWVEALAFFFSKWINPKRKARDLALLSPKDRGKAALQLALDQRMSEVVWVTTGRKRGLRSFPRKKLDVFEAARVLGSLLGERLFVAVRKGRITQERIIEWARVPVLNDDFREFYWRLLKRLGTR